MVDFTNAREELNNYSGSEKKKTLIYNNLKYLVKFPDPIREKNKNISYINNAYSEYLGSNIFKLCGFSVQKTILGTYLFNDKTKIVCACQDFTDDNHLLYEFEKITFGINIDKKIDTELSDIMEVLDESKQILNINDIKDNFYDMFIIDALIGNTDRHNGNWGFIYDKINNTYSFSPIYDNGSCLNPIISDEDILKIDNEEIKNLAVNFYSCLKEDGHKINYFNYLKEKKNNSVNNALIRVFNNIDIDKINNFIDNTPYISDIRKDFYKKIINIRYNIIKDIYNSLI